MKRQHPSCDRSLPLQHFLGIPYALKDCSACRSFYTLLQSWRNLYQLFPTCLPLNLHLIHIIEVDLMRECFLATGAFDDEVPLVSLAGEEDGVDPLTEGVDEHIEQYHYICYFIIMYGFDYDNSTIVALYRLSDQFSVLCAILDSFNNLMSKQQSDKIELDIPEGQESFREYMQSLQKLGEKLGIRTVDRSYRKSFSRAYSVLFVEGHLCYIPEILDSAQEGFPYLWVNGEKFEFSYDVLLKGERLMQNFYKVERILRLFYTKVESFVQGLEILTEKAIIRAALEEFDACWTDFQKQYILELMNIESKARSPMEEAIVAEAYITKYQNEQRCQGRIFFKGQQYRFLRQQLCRMIAHLNSVANYEGKGRDDLTVQILQQAQQILHKVSIKQSKSIRILAENIRNAFNNLRKVFQNYGQSPQIIDPQLRNNPELVQALINYEKYWQEGKHYFLNQKTRNQLLLFSQIVEATGEKYPQFEEMLQCSDPSIFMMIPSLIILKSLQSQDFGLAKQFLGDIDQPGCKHNQQYAHLKLKYSKWRQEDSLQRSGYHYYNIVEESLIKDSSPNQTIKQIVTMLKMLAVQLQRVNPTEWNSILNVILTYDQIN